MEIAFGGIVKTIYRHTFLSPIGRIHLLATEQGVCFLDFFPDAASAAGEFLARHFPDAVTESGGRHNLEAERQLQAYLAGSLSRFTIPVDLLGTEFQKRVLRHVAEIPAGQTKTYGQIARELGKAGASRAVGGANRRNPIPIIIPCHRVVASDGLGGYGGKPGAVPIKRKLLALEGALVNETET
jgi:O-6-methylguanine DNA methyltransferase